jgi:hypothetical protein
VEAHTAPRGAEFGMRAPVGALNASPPRPIPRKSKSCCYVHSRTFSLDNLLASRGDNHGDIVTAGVTECLRRHI